MQHELHVRSHDHAAILMSKAVFTIWEGDGITLKVGTQPPQLSPGDTRILEFEANTWEEACQRQCDHYGWGKYHPPDPPAGPWEYPPVDRDDKPA